jgi:sucrose-6-phosphate hydrolase SacC (GH32 family)
MAFVAMSATAANDSKDVVIADFEGQDYAGWKVTGDAFGKGPAQGTLPGQMHVSGFEGKGLVNSFLGGDGATGSLRSPEFRIDRKYVRFLIGGGRDEARLVMRLIVDGKPVRSATGPNDSPGGTEELSPAGWDVAEFAGKQGAIEIVDTATGGWGHINVDQIVLTDAQPPQNIHNATKEMVATEGFLHFPIRNGGRKRNVTLYVDGKKIVRNQIELADDAPDWWAPMDISQWKGRKLKIEVDTLPGNAKTLDLIAQRDFMVDDASLYREPLRGQLHFSPKRGWNNDPNGLVFYKGEYHMFFQHNPYGWGWGNMHWGHAVSRDLVHWQELGDVLWPDDLGPMFSGGAVVDVNNTSGLGTKENPPLVLFYTAAGDPTVQCVASSTDGRKFVKYSRNPVIGQVTGGNRDPKVIWHEPSKQWVMVLYVEKPQGLHTIHFFVSKNLLDWKLASIFDGDKVPGRYMYECPEFFPLAVDGDPAKVKWVLMAADGQYAVGSFDGTKFTAERDRLQSQHGRGFYAAQTFSDIPREDGRRIRVGWWQTETRGMPFNQSMTLPHELKLVSTPEGPTLTILPVKELESLRTASKDELNSLSITGRGPMGPLGILDTDLAEIRLNFGRSQPRAVLNLRGAEIVVDRQAGELKVNDLVVKLPKVKQLDLIIYSDRTGLEIFAAGGLVYVPFPFQQKPENRKFSLKLEGERPQIDSIQSYNLKSIWNKAD